MKKLIILATAILLLLSLACDRKSADKEVLREMKEDLAPQEEDSTTTER